MTKLTTASPIIVKDAIMRTDDLSGSSRLAWLTWASLLILITLVHLFHNATNIGLHAFDMDEASTYLVAAHPIGRILTLPTEFHSQPPAYYLLLHFWMKLNSREWFLRSLSWLFCYSFLLFAFFALEELSLFARVVLCILYASSGFAVFLSHDLRPYALASTSTFVSLILFLRLLQAPTRRQPIGYVAVTLLSLYSHSFCIWPFAIEALWVAIMVLAESIRRGVRAALERRRALILAIAITGVAYIPYFIIVWHYQHNAPFTGHPTWKAAWAAATDMSWTKRELSSVFLPAGLGLSAWVILAVAGTATIISAIASGSVDGLVLLTIVLGHIAAVCGFLNARSFVADRYFSMVWAPFLYLIALAIDATVRGMDRRCWPAIIAGMSVFVWELSAPFADYARTKPPEDGYRSVASELRHMPGQKVIFFDSGWEGQELEYYARQDPSVHLRMNKTRSWGCGGDAMTPEYVAAQIRITHDGASCYLYLVHNDPKAAFRSVFLPSMKRLGFTEGSPFGKFRIFCRAPTPASPVAPVR